MNYKKKNGHRRKIRLHGFRTTSHDPKKNLQGSCHTDNWSTDGAKRRYLRAFLAVEEE